MKILEAITKRYSCRSYRDKSIEREKLAAIFEAARLAPSAKNLQDWRFVVVTEKDKKQRLAETTNRPEVFGTAGAIIAACSNNDYVMSCGQPSGPINVAIALEHIALQAAELGLATCWIGSFNPAKVKMLLKIPDDVTVIELMAIGYPVDKFKEHDREPIENILCYESWQF